ncbi:unnamed protein product [Fusarium graminearum]|nr:unnamed protein product [Fusarium graminearum]
MTFTLRSVLFAAVMALSAAPASALVGTPFVHSEKPVDIPKTIKPSFEKIARGRDPSKNLGLHKRDYSINIQDGSASAACPTGNCCSPICKMDVKFDECPGGAKEYPQSCKKNFDDTKAFDRESFTYNCDGWSIFWEDGAVDGGRFITVEQGDTGNFYQFFVEGCKDTDPSWDPFQCSSLGGGCTAKASGLGTGPKKEQS